MTTDAEGGREDGERPPVRQLRLVVQVDDLDAAVHFYRDVLGLAVEDDITSEGDARVVILDAGRATLELANLAQAEFIDRVEVGRRVAGKYRVAMEVDDAELRTRTAIESGASLIAPPTVTPWQSLNARLEAPGGIQLTLFEELDSD